MLINCRKSITGKRNTVCIIYIFCITVAQASVFQFLMTIATTMAIIIIDTFA